MTKTVRLPDDVHAELVARKRPDETMAETIARHLQRPHPAETRAALSSDDADAISAELDSLYDGEEDRLSRVREAFVDADEDES